MKNILCNIFIVILYCIPFGYITMYADCLDPFSGSVVEGIRSGTLVDIGSVFYLFAFLLAGALLLGTCTGFMGYYRAAIIGNILSFLVSLVLTMGITDPVWNTYFAPFGPIGFLILVTLIFIAIQWLFYKLARILIKKFSCPHQHNYYK